MEKEILMKEWLKTKKAEKKQQEKRIEIENQLLELYGTEFSEKSKTYKEDEIGFSINIKKNTVYKIDQEAWKSIRTEIQENLRPEKISFSLDIKGFEYLKENKYEIYQKVSDCVEIKNNKPTIKIEKLK